MKIKQSIALFSLSALLLTCLRAFRELKHKWSLPAPLHLPPFIHLCVVITLSSPLKHITHTLITLLVERVCLKA